jgi:hypothetical protein
MNASLRRPQGAGSWLDGGQHLGRSVTAHVAARTSAHSATPVSLGPPTRPRRILQPRPDLTIRREQTRDGYSLHFTGRLATSDFCDRIFDEKIERMLAPE